MKYDKESLPNIVDELLKDTNNLNEPIVYKNFFDDGFLNHEDVKAAINTAIKSTAKENFRVWVNKNEDYDAASTIINTPINVEETLEQWTNRVFEKRKFCIVFSQAGQFHDEVAIKAGEFLHRIFQRLGMSFGGCSISFFIGNYGFTPAGVHLDSNESNIFHFHLGPGFKELFIWDTEVFKSLTGSTDAYHQPEKILDHARAFGLHTNDFLSLPPKYYHIGRTEDFSVDMALVISDCTNIKLTKEIFKTLTLEGVTSCDAMYKLKNANINHEDSSLMSDFNAHICVNERNNDKSFKDVIASQIESYYLTMLSNMGWSSPPMLASRQDAERIFDKKVQIMVPFKIHYKIIDAEKMTLYMRGRILVSKYHSEIIRIIDKLNTAEICNVTDLLQEYFDNSAENKRLLVSFLARVAEHKAISILD